MGVVHEAWHAELGYWCAAAAVGVTTDECSQGCIHRGDLADRIEDSEEIAS